MTRNGQKDSAAACPNVPDDGHVNNHDGASVPAESLPKRQKRGKYVSQACGECQKRKIKCDGKIPCRTCLFRGRNCNKQSTDMRRSELTAVDQVHQPSTALGAGVDVDPNRNQAQNELTSRLDRIEHQLSFLVSSASRGMGRLNGAESANLQKDAVDFRARSFSSPSFQKPTKAPVSTFSGETSIAHTLDQVEGHLAHIGGAYQDRDSATTSQTARALLPPSPVSHRDDISGDWEKFHIREVLGKFNIEPDRPRWDEFLDTFCEEIHILYPMVHLPTLRLNYLGMWNKYLFSDHELAGDNHRFTIAQLWICLAIGRCTQSPRLYGEDGRHSAGWSFYDAAMHLFGDLLTSFQECSSPILVLQTLILIVIYLFRLDANEKGEKVLSLAISHSHHLGLHRRKVVDTIPVFNSEMARRVWWCIYLMDRRLAIETGHPFLIQDVNVDIPLPRELSDDWLTSHQDDPRISPDIDAEIEAEVARTPFTTIPYLVAMINYSRVVGKAWEGMYGVSSTESTPSPLLCEYLEQHVSRAQKEINPEFVQDNNRSLGQYSNSAPWWRIKQRTLMHIRWYSLRLLIRKPMLQQALSTSNPVTDSLQNEITCMQIAHNIIQGFNKIPKEHARSIFPFLYYFVTATMISLGLIIKEPSFKATHGNDTIQAARLLRSYCGETWISGRMARTIHRLNQMAAHILNENGMPGRSFSHECRSNFSECSGSLPPSQRPALDSRASNTTFPAADTNSQPNDFLPGQGPSDRPVSSAHDDMQNQPLSYSNTGMNRYGTTEPDLHYPTSQQDNWALGLANVVMADFDFEESTVSNFGPPFGWHGNLFPNPTWPQDAASAFPASEIGATGSYGPQSAVISEEQTNALPAVLRQNVDPGEVTGVEIDWLQSLFWDSIGSYS